MTFNKNEVTIHSACDVDTNLLIDFYKKVYPNRMNYLESNWKWLNRSDFYENKIPLVLVYQNQVIAHSGMIPFNILMCGDLQTASWFIDFEIVPELQRHGLGTILTREWMSFSDFSVTFCNDKSIGVFKKFGWIESFDTYLHFNYMLPFSHPVFVTRLPAFIRKILNYIAYPIFFLIYSKHTYSNNSYQLEKLNKKSFDAFFDFYTETKKDIEKTISPLRNIHYVNWRVLNSPNKDKYYIYKTEKFSALVSLQNNYGNYIDILWVTDINDQIEIKKMISTLGVYGIRNGFSYIRFYTSKKELSHYIKNKTKSRVLHPRFAYFSKSEYIFNKLKKANWDFELIDSDFEYVK